MELFIIIWLLILASARVGKNIYVDARAQIRDPSGPAPSLVERERRAKLAQQQAATTGAPGVGQAIADRLASRIANPPPRPAWLAEALAYLALLLADGFARARRRHVQKQRARQHRERSDQRGDQPRPGQHGSPYCWACEYNHVARAGQLCDDCTAVVTQRCPGCGVFVPAVELHQHERCSTCRQPRTRSPRPGDPPGPARLVIPS